MHKKTLEELAFTVCRFFQGMPAETLRFICKFYAYRRGSETRMAYWQGVIGLQVVDAILLLCSALAPTLILSFFRLIFVIIDYFAVFSATCRRMRDAGKPDWMPALILFVMLVPSLCLDLLALLCDFPGQNFRMKFALACNILAFILWLVTLSWCFLPDKETQERRKAERKNRKDFVESIRDALMRKAEGK